MCHETKLQEFHSINGWLKSFCACHQIKFSRLHGESAQVSQDATQQWMQDLPKVTKGYELHDIYNCDEMSMFFKALPKKTLFGPGEKSEEIKTSKERFSILVSASAIGKKEKLLIIRKSKWPQFSEIQF